MRLEGALGDDRAVALVLEVVAHLPVGDVPGDGRGLRPLHIDDDVVLQGVAVALQEDVVRGQAGAPYPDAPAAHDVLDAVGVGPGQAGLRERLQIAVEGREDLVAVRRVQLDRAAARGEAALVVTDLGHRVQQREPGPRARVAQRVQQRALGGVQGERRHLVILGAGRQVVDTGAVGGGVHADQLADLPVAERLRVADQRDGGGEALEVPGEGAHIRLVEVVDVEDQPSVGVHVRAEVLGVQIAVHPHPARALVQVRAPVVAGRAVGPGGQVVVEQAGGAPVEGEGGGGHLPELDPEGRRVGRQKFTEGGLENGEYLLAAPRGPVLLGRHRWVLLGCRAPGTAVPPAPTRGAAPECPAVVGGPS